VRRLHHPAADVQGRADDAIGADPCHREDDADDVDDRVERADFVQVDLLHRHLVDRRLRVAEALKHRLRPITTRWRETRPIDQLENLGKTPMRVMVLARTSRVLGGCSNVLGGCSNVLGGSSNVLDGSSNLPARCARVLVMVMVVGVIVRVLVHRELGCRHAGAQHALGVDVRVAEREAAERAFQLVERQAGVEQRAERHVAGDAREAIEVERFHSRRDSLKLQ
jgi:hypothetical protein